MFNSLQCQMVIKTQIQKLETEQESEINGFLYTHPNNTIFQSPAFYTLYLSTKNYTPYYFLLYDSGVLAGLMLAVVITEGNGIISRHISRCVIQGGPIVLNDNIAFIDALLRTLNTTLGKRTLITQFRNYRKWEQNAVEIFSANGFVFHDHLNLILTQHSREATLSGLSASRRRQLKKGLESGAILRQAASMHEVRAFYGLLNDLYHRRVKKPLPGLHFFEQFYTQFVLTGKGIIMLVVFENKIIGGIVSPITPGHTIYEFYICGLDKEYPKQYPSVLATWAAMEWATEHQIPAFDFMGLGKPDVPYGVRDFKLRFGGEQVNYGRFGRRNYKLVYSIAETGYNLIRSLKRR